jgi:hypothetical protein
MRIIGCDLHARQQSVAMLDTEPSVRMNPRTPKTDASESSARVCPEQANTPRKSSCNRRPRLHSTQSSNIRVFAHDVRMPCDLRLRSRS